VGETIVMTVASRSAKTTQWFVPSPTSGLEDDALLIKRPPQSDEWGQRIDELLDIRRMEDDWDGLGAPAPSTALVDSALSLAQILRQDRDPPPCRIVAGLTGTVLFEWQDADGRYSELEVTAPHLAEWVQIVPGKPTVSAAIEW
jgi:hypothetical protein